MTGYLTGFLVYTLAMLGVIFIAFVIVKKSLVLGHGKQNNSFLKVESSLNIEPRKNIYVLKAGRERFLVSSGIDGCQFMTKLEDSNFPIKIENQEIKNTNNTNNISNINNKMATPKMELPKIEISALSPDYIGLKKILRGGEGL